MSVSPGHKVFFFIVATTLTVFVVVVENNEGEPFAVTLRDAAREFEGGHYGAAASLYEGVLRVDPENEVAIEGYADALLALDEALAYEFIEGRSGLGARVPPKVAAVLAELWCRRGLSDSALDLIKENETAKAFFVRGRIYLYKGNIPRAIKELKDADFSGVPGADYFLAEAMLSAGRFTEARYYLRGFTLSHPELACGYAALAETYLRTDDLDKAQDLYEKALELDSRCTRAMANLAYIAYVNKDYSASIKGCNRVLNIKPGDADALYNLATVYEKVDKSVARMKWQEFVNNYDGVPGEVVRVKNAKDRIENL